MVNPLDLVLKETSGFKEKLLYVQEIYKEQELPKKKQKPGVKFLLVDRFGFVLKMFYFLPLKR